MAKERQINEESKNDMLKGYWVDHNKITVS